MQSYSQNLLKPCLMLLLALFSTSTNGTLPEGPKLIGPFSLGVGNAFVNRNPFGTIPSNPTNIPGLTARNFLEIFTADLNSGVWSVQDYSKGISEDNCKEIFKQIGFKSEDPGSQTQYEEYDEIKRLDETTDPENLAKKIAFLDKIHSILLSMINSPTNCYGFYNYRNMLILKQGLLWLTITAARQAKDKGLPLKEFTFYPAIQKIAEKILNFENRLLELGLLNDTRGWEKAKKGVRILFRPFTASYKKLNPFRPDNTKERSTVFYEFLTKEYLSLEKEIKNLEERIETPALTEEWKTTTNFDKDTFVDRKGDLPGSLRPLKLIPKSKKAAKHRISLHPFGRLSSAPSPIPGISWRRLAEICRTDRQLIHALDFSPVVDWASFLEFMANDSSACVYSNGRLGMFLQLYAPATYRDLFKSQNPTTLNDTERKALLHRFITTLIGQLNEPHKAFKSYKKRTAITALEAELLTKLFNLYTNGGNRSLVGFPEVSYQLHNPGLELKERFDPFNIELYLNTNNLTLKEICLALRTLDSTEIKANRMNRHSSWHKALQISKTIPGVVALPLTLPGKAAFTRQRTAKFSQKFKDTQRDLVADIRSKLSTLKRTDINRHFSRHTPLFMPEIPSKASLYMVKPARKQVTARAPVITPDSKPNPIHHSPLVEPTVVAPAPILAAGAA